MKNDVEVVSVKADVLIIGGGLAGCMAAIKASESGQKVVIAEKANTLASGCAGSGIDHMWSHIPEVHNPMGWTTDEMVDNHIKAVSHGFVNQDLCQLVINTSYERMLDLEKFGINFRFEDSKLPGKFRVVSQLHCVPDSFNFDGRLIKVHLTKAAKRRGVKIYNRVSMTELLTSDDGHITGALGIGTRDGKLYHFRAKAIVMSTGRVNRLTRNQTGVWGNLRLPAYETGDGRYMAFRAGVPIINMEFLSPQRFSIGNYELNLGSPRNTVQPAGAVVDGNNRNLIPRTDFFDFENKGGKPLDLEAARQAQMQVAFPNYQQLIKEGQGPFFLDLTGGTDEEIKYIEWSIINEGKGSLFLDYLKRQENFDFRRDKLEWLPNSREMAGTASSGLAVDKHLETGIKGLFAAGDEVGGMPWSASTGAFTMGWRAGENAAREAARHKKHLDGGADATESLAALMQRMSGNGHGHTWQEVETAVQNIVDYYASNVRAENMLQRGLERLEDLQRIVDLRAEAPHETGRCLEVLSLIENAAMIMRGSIQRKESRRMPFGFMRADYPDPNDAEYFAFLGQTQKGNAVQYSKFALPH